MSLSANWISHFISLYFSGDKFSVAEAIRLKDNFIPKNLFRFRHLKPSHGKMYTYDEIKYNYVYMSNPTSFNDPFDTVAYYDIDKHMKKIVLSPSSVDFLISENKKCFEHVKECISLRASRLAQNSVRVCCFSEAENNNTPTNMPMWYHYADCYTGICIRYDMSTFNQDDLQRVRMFPVNYISNMLDSTEIFTDNNNIGFDTKIAMHKHSDWGYEKEWRFIIGNGIVSDENANFKFPSITAIYMGYKICVRNENILSNIAREKNIPLFKMTIKNGGVEFRPVSV